MSTIAFLSIGMHGHINPTLPVVAELVRRGHAVSYHTSPAFREEIESTGATVHLYPGGDRPFPDPPTPVTWMESLASTAVRMLPAVLTDLRRDRPDLIVHDSACLWGAVAARELGVPAGLLVHHVRPEPACPEPHPWLLGTADRGDGTTPQCPGLPAVPLGAAPPL